MMSNVQALLEPFCIAAARTKRPALLARLQDGVFGELLQIGSTGALANLDMRTVAARLFDLGEFRSSTDCAAE